MLRNGALLHVVIEDDFRFDQGLHVCRQKRVFLIYFVEPKPALPGNEDVHPAILVLFHDPVDSGDTPDIRQFALVNVDDSESSIALQAGADHFLVALLEDVKRQALGGIEYDSEWKQRELLNTRHELNIWLRSLPMTILPPMFRVR